MKQSKNCPKDASYGTKSLINHEMSPPCQQVLEMSHWCLQGWFATSGPQAIVKMNDLIIPTQHHLIALGGSLKQDDDSKLTMKVAQKWYYLKKKCFAGLRIGVSMFVWSTNIYMTKILMVFAEEHFRTKFEGLDGTQICCEPFGHFQFGMYNETNWYISWQGQNHNSEVHHRIHYAVWSHMSTMKKNTSVKGWENKYWIRKLHKSK